MASYSSQAAESTFIYEAAATTNFGTNAALSIGRSAAGQIRRSLVRFPSLPTPVRSVSDVILSLYSSSEGLGSARDVNVYRIILAWIEGQATYNIWKTSNNWNTAGCGGAADFESTSIGSATVSATIAANAEVQVTLDNTLFAAYLNALGTYAGGFLLKMYEAGTDYWNPHSNDAANPAYGPKLAFNYIASDVKTVNGVAYDDIKSVSGLSIASVKSIGGVE